MQTFKIIFAHNVIMSIVPTHFEYNFQGDVYCYKHNGFIVYAIIKATSEKEAQAKAENIIVEYFNSTNTLYA